MVMLGVVVLARHARRFADAWRGITAAAVAVAPLYGPSVPRRGRT